MRRSTILAAAVLALLVGGLAAYLISFYTVDPTFSVTVQKDERGDYRFTIDPNFVVKSIYSARITDSNGLLVERDQAQAGTLYLTIPGSVPAATKVTVSCSLQYDRIAPSLIEVEKEVVLP